MAGLIAKHEFDVIGNRAGHAIAGENQAQHRYPFGAGAPFAKHRPSPPWMANSVISTVAVLGCSEITIARDKHNG